MKANSIVKQSFHITLKSSNVKTGPIPVSTSSSDSCPTTCGQFKACYAKSGPLAMHWRKVDAGARGISLRELCETIAALPAGQLWRHNQAGDLPGRDQQIDRFALDKLVTANAGRRGFSYSHKPLTPANAAAIRDANARGFVINVSADSLAAADRAKAANVGPVVVVLPAGATQNTVTPAGHKVVVCPAQTHAGVNCAKCRLCSWAGRDVVIGFAAHGSNAKHARTE